MRVSNSRHSEHSEADLSSSAARSRRHATGSLRSNRDERALRRALAIWFRKNQRDLPWRRTHDPYAVLVSEIMLQQTNVATVLAYYKRWLRRFPTLSSLARASEEQVLHAWQGLGYYSRARNLHRCAKISVARFSGKLPSNAAQLRSLPGLGRYTANAIGVFAFEHSLPIVEANTARVLARLYNIEDCIHSTDGREKLWNASTGLVPKRGARNFQSAMMDLGALICIAGQPRCHICPIKNFCAAPQPHLLPNRRARPAVVSLHESHAFIEGPNGILLQRCHTRWRGMWMLPSAISDRINPIYSSRFPFTHHQVILQIFTAKARRQTKDERWFPIRQLNRIPIPSPHRRALEAILGRNPSPKQC